MAKEPGTGDLKDRVAIQRLRTPPEGSEYGGWGADESHWETVATRRARVRELGGFELFHARQSVAETDVLVDIRWTGGFEGLDSAMRFRWVNRGNKVLNILRVTNPDEHKVWHLAYCKM